MQIKQEKEEKKRESKKLKQANRQKGKHAKKTCMPEPLFNEDEIPLTDSEPDDAICPKCGLHYALRCIKAWVCIEKFKVI